MDVRRALAALSIAWAVRAGRAIPVRWSVRPHRPAHPDSALPLVRKSPHGGADRPLHLARHATISSLCYPPLYGGTPETLPPRWMVVSARNTLPTAVNALSYSFTEFPFTLCLMRIPSSRHFKSLLTSPRNDFGTAPSSRTGRPR